MHCLVDIFFPYTDQWFLIKLKLFYLQYGFLDHVIVVAIFLKAMSVIAAVFKNFENMSYFVFSRHFMFMPYIKAQVVVGLEYLP